MRVLLAAPRLLSTTNLGYPIRKRKAVFRKQNGFNRFYVRGFLAVLFSKHSHTLFIPSPLFRPRY